MQIEEYVSGIVKNDDMVEQIMEGIKNIMRFDPSASRYTPELGQSMKEYRHKLRDEQGISTYITCGTKKRYEALKAQAINDISQQ